MVFKDYTFVIKFYSAKIGDPYKGMQSNSGKMAITTGKSNVLKDQCTKLINMNLEASLVSGKAILTYSMSASLNTSIILFT